MSSGSEIGEHFPLNRNQHVRTRRSFDWSVCKDRSITNEGLTDSGTRADKHSGDKHSGDDVMFKVATKDPWHVRCSRCCNCNSSIAIGNLIYESSFCSRLCLTSWKVARYKRMFEGYEKHESKLELEAAVIAHRKSTGSTDSTDSTDQSSTEDSQDASSFAPSFRAHCGFRQRSGIAGSSSGNRVCFEVLEVSRKRL
jgi:hypothetical protein